MELLTVVDDFFVTASLALLLTFIVLKLVEAINDIHTTPKRHVHVPPQQSSRAQLRPAQTNTKVRFISPAQAVTCVGTQHNVEEVALNPVRLVPCGKRLTVQHPQTETVETECNTQQNTVQLVPVATACVETEGKIEKATVEPVRSILTVQPGQSESTVDFISPVQALTCVGTEHEVEEATVESDSNTVVESALKSDTDIVVKEVIAEANKEKTQEFHDSSEKRGVESVEEIRVEPPTEVEVSVVESNIKENYNDDDDDDDDWEGIERSELEKEFMAATEFVSKEDDRLRSVGSNVKMELYGLHKVATEGPCHEPQPMPLKLYARAKWNAWQKLGNMSPEVAMEQYISLLSDKFPGWMKYTFPGMSEHEPAGPEVSESAASDMSTALSHQQMIIREFEQESDSKNRNPLTESDLENNVKK